MTSDATKASSSTLDKAPSTGGNKPEDPDTKQEAQSASGSKRNRNNRNRKKTTSSTGNGADATTLRTKFVGNCPALKGHIYQLGPNQADIYIKTTKALATYIGQNYTKEARIAIENRKDHAFAKPTMPRVVDETTKQMRAKTEDELDYIEKKEIDYELKHYMQEQKQYRKDMHQIHSIVHGQCTDAMIQKMKADASYKEAEEEADPIKLLNIIKKICYSYQAEQFPILSLAKALKRLVNIKQGHRETNVDYLDRFNNAYTVFTSCGGTLALPGATTYICRINYKKKAEDCTEDQKLAVLDEIDDLMLATLYLENASDRYAPLRKELANDYLKSSDINNYPQNLVTAQNLLLNYRPAAGEASQVKSTSTPEVMFAQQSSGHHQQQQSTTNAPRRDIADLICSDCGGKGHYPRSPKCPVYQKLVEDAMKHRKANATRGGNETPHPKEQPQAESAAQVLMYGTNDTETAVMFCQTSTESSTGGDEPEDPDTKQPHTKQFKYSQAILSQAPGSINTNWCLIDSQSTCDVFINKQFLTNVRVAPNNQCIRIHCNAGTIMCNTVGDLPGYGTVWYYPSGIANVLSLARVQQKYRVTYDSREGNAFVVHSQHRPTFVMSAAGLYYHDMGTAPTGHLLAGLDEETDEETEAHEQKLVSGIPTVDKIKQLYSKRDVARASRARKFQDVIGASLKTLLHIIDNKLLPNCPVTRDDVNVAEHIYGPSIANLKGKTTRRQPSSIENAVAPLPPEIVNKYKNVTLCADIMYVNGIRFLTSISRHLRFVTGTHVKSAGAESLLGHIIALKQIYMQRGFVIKHLHMDGQFEPLKNSLAGEGINLDVTARDEHVPEAERNNRTIKERMRGVYNTLPFKALTPTLIIELAAACIFWLNAFPLTNGISRVMSPREIVTGRQLDYNRHCKLRFGEYVHVHDETDNTMKSRTTGALALRPTGNSQGGYYYWSLATGRRLTRGYSTPLPIPREAISTINNLAKNAQQGLEFADRNEQPFDDDNSVYEPPPSDSDEDLSVDTYDDPILHDEPAHNPTDDDDDTHENTEVRNDDDDTQGGDSNASADEEAMQEPEPPEPPTLRNRPRVNYKQLATVGFTSVMAGTRALGRVLKAYTQVIHAISNYNDSSPFEYVINHTMLSQYSLKKGLKIFGEDGANAVRKEMKQLYDRRVIRPCPVQSLTKAQIQNALSYLMLQ